MTYSYGEFNKAISALYNVDRRKIRKWNFWKGDGSGNDLISGTGPALTCRDWKLSQKDSSANVWFLGHIGPQITPRGTVLLEKGVLFQPVSSSSCILYITNVHFRLQNISLCHWNVPIPVAARSAAVRLLGFWVWIPPGVWMSVFLECCVLSGKVLCAKGQSLVQRSPTECGVSECDLETSIMRRPRPTRAIKPLNGNVFREK
jgi:hypothetical protein